MPKYKPGDVVNLLPGYSPRQLTIVAIRPKARTNFYSGVSTHRNATGRPVCFGDDVIADKVATVDPTTVDVRDIRQERQDDYDVAQGQRFALAMAESNDGLSVSDQWLALSLLEPGDTVKIRSRGKVIAAVFQRVMIQGQKFHFTAKKKADAATTYKFPVTSVVV
jgi:hypothetical protein